MKEFEARLARAECPVHGHAMDMISVPIEDAYGYYWWKGCIVATCNVCAKTRKAFGPCFDLSPAKFEILAAEQQRRAVARNLNQHAADRAQERRTAAHLALNRGLPRSHGAADCHAPARPDLPVS
jgi:hypothetical protein